MLESLELFGFKSFADRTLFEFSPGITCVVGPNGSGKSNVVDAIKWILGDQSPKSLRGQEMADVIFNGSAGRRASGFAEATLTFDNSRGTLPIDASHVQIGRRLYQSGDSEYLLNRSPVRLKDIRDLFLGTGAGTAAYSIIEQGRVDQILQANPTNRRVVFEEAAGISKFKSRRVDAERRLERVAQNLLRLTDIVDQVESQLNSVRSQASKAARYRELSAELKAAWTGLAADDCRMLSAQLNELLDELERIAAERNAVQELIDQSESRKQAVDLNLAAWDDELLRRERETTGLREATASHQSTIRHQSRRFEELKADRKRLGPQRASLARQVEFASAELAETAEQLTAFEEQFVASRQQLADREVELGRLDQLAAERRQGMQQRRNELSRVQERHNRLAERLAAVLSQMESLSQNQNQAQRRLEHLEQQLDSARQVRTDRELALTEAENALHQRGEQFTHTQSAQSQLLLQHSEAERGSRQLRERRTAAEARLALLEELEQRQEGIAVGVRDILLRAESSHYPPWSSILGLVRDLIEVPLAMAPTIDAALGDRAQLIAVTELSPLLEYLNRGAAPIDGRVGFVAIHQPAHDVVCPGLAVLELQAAESACESLSGVYGRADRLVQERDRAVGIAARVLGDTWIVETLDVAEQLVARGPAGTRAVTLQGEVLCQDQHLYVGGLPHESSIVSRKSELRQIKNEIHQLDRNLEAMRQRQSLLSEHVESQSDEVDVLDSELKALSNAVTERRSQFAEQAREVTRLEQDQAEQLATLETLDTRASESERSADSIREQIADVQRESAGISAGLASESEQMAEIEALLEQTRQEIKTEQLELAKHEARLHNLGETQGRLTRDQKHRRQQLEDITHRETELREALRKSQFEILNAESQVATLALQLDHAMRDARGIYSDRERLRSERAELIAIEERHHQQRRGLLDRQHAVEFEIQKRRHQLTTLAERIDEEFQTPLEQLVESGASAYGEFLTERYGTDAAREIISHAADAQSGAAAFAGTEDAPHRSVLVPTYEEVRSELEARVDRLRRKIKMMGTVNTDALEALDELEQRHGALASQLKDLQEAKAVLEDIIRRINHESQRIFLETFETVRQHFRELFRKLFGGGDAEIILEDPQDVLECGIEIVARPPGKELRSISLLSGGEKTMTAVALIFAIFRSKPSPYCILDEVDAALDEANVDRYVGVVKEFAKMTQFVVITHRKRTMTAADVLYGVTMEQAGVSKKISVRFEDVRDNGEIRTAA